MAKDEYFELYDKLINYDAKTHQIVKPASRFNISVLLSTNKDGQPEVVGLYTLSKLDIAALLSIPLLLTVVSVFVLKSVLATALSGLVWAYMIYIILLSYVSK